MQSSAAFWTMAVPRQPVKRYQLHILGCAESIPEVGSPPNRDLPVDHWQVTGRLCLSPCSANPQVLLLLNPPTSGRAGQRSDELRRHIARALKLGISQRKSYVAETLPALQLAPCVWLWGRECLCHLVFAIRFDSTWVSLGSCSPVCSVLIPTSPPLQLIQGTYG